MSDPIDHIKNRIDRPGDLSLQVHSLFVNLEGTRYIGQPGGLPDLCLEEDSITFVHGRLPHCDKGRSRAQGSHIVINRDARVCARVLAQHGLLGEPEFAAAGRPMEDSPRHRGARRPRGQYGLAENRQVSGLPTVQSSASFV